MIYELKNSRNGENAIYNTTVKIEKAGNAVSFYFHCINTKYYCPYDYYNGIHSYGDACEILIGTDPARRVYYEMEISADGVLMLAKMQNHGFDETGEPILDIGFVDKPFIKGEVSKFENGYDAVLSFDLGDINTGDGEVYFNAYRLETDGGNKNAHLFALNPTLHDWFHVPNRFVYLKDFVK